MKLNSLKPSKGATKSKKRSGRGGGSGLGRTAGRGEKGYHARSGSKNRSWFEGGQMPIHRRLPKRGFSNSLFRKTYQVVNLQAINELGLETVDAQILHEKGLVQSALQPIKILGDGNIESSVKVTASCFSKSAKEKIEQAGGSIEVQ
ncbi:MAG TPA: 50S ribosomal protein L15 [Candidatus Marinimicrobia bacterium]|jgi:large subunit ribosomal protein L15|nr:50S ribosomal protein L15 [Candidatus Neomarinimicrobiota bacterium]